MRNYIFSFIPIKILINRLETLVGGRRQKDLLCLGYFCWKSSKMEEPVISSLIHLFIQNFFLYVSSVKGIDIH